MDEKITPKITKQSPDASKRAVWDCDSALYDSFELKAFEKQLSSAISSRTMSMPHLSDRRFPPPPPPSSKKPTSKISRSIQKLVRSVFSRPKNQNNDKNCNPLFGEGFMRRNSKEGFYVVYDKSGALTTIPEVPEFDGLSPEIRSLVTRTTSDRFSGPTSIGISCA